MSAIPRIAIFASGGGSNARQLIRHFAGTVSAEVVLLVCNKPGAGALEVAAANGIPSLLINRADLEADGLLSSELGKARVDVILLAGYLWKIPGWLIARYPDRILNIHPALLPSFGGKGMYGHHVHEAVHAARESYSGITIHLVNEHYDEGRIIFQASIALDHTDTPARIEEKVRALEQLHYPRVAEQFIFTTA